MANRKFLFSVGLVTIGLIFGKITAFFKHFIIVKIFGISYLADAFFIANTLNEMTINIVLAGLISGAFIPFASKIWINKGIHKFRELASASLIGMGIFLILLAVILFVFSGSIAALMAPGYTGEYLEDVSQLIRIFSPGIVFIGLAAVLTGILQTHEDFRAPSFGFFVHNSITILFTLFLHKYWGIYAAAIGTSVGFACWFLIQLPFAWKYLRQNFSFFSPELFEISSIAIPVIFIILFSNIILIVEKIVASHFFEGAVSQLNLALRLVVIISNLAILPVSTVLLPRFSKYASEQDFEQLYSATNRALTLVSYIMMVAIPLAILNAPLITYVVYVLTGANQAMLNNIANYFTIYAFSFVGIFYYMILLRLFFAVQRIGNLVQANFLGFVIYLGFLLLLPLFKMKTLPLAYAAFYWASTGFLMAMLKIKLFPGRVFPVNLTVFYVATGSILVTILLTILKFGMVINLILSLFLAIFLTVVLIKFDLIDYRELIAFKRT